MTDSRPESNRALTTRETSESAAADWRRFLEQGLTSPAALREFLRLTSRLCGDVPVAVYLGKEGGAAPGLAPEAAPTAGAASEAPAWRCVAAIPGSGDRVDARHAIGKVPQEVMHRIARELEVAEVASLPGNDPPLAAARLGGTTRDADRPIVVAAAESWNAGSLDLLADRLALACRAPEIPFGQRQVDRASRDLARFGACLELTSMLARQQRFLGAAFLLVNELAARFHSDRVSLGWMRNGSIEVKAVSHTEKIEPKMELVRTIAAAMEEAVDQGIEIVWPADPGSGAVARDHGLLAKAADARHVATVPILLPEVEAGREFDATEEVGTRFRGALLLERDAAPFDGEDLAHLRLVADQCARLLDDLHRTDRWIGARFALAAREAAARFVGPSHTGWKLLGLGVAALLVASLFITRQHRVEAPFSLETDSVAFVASPFEGFISEVRTEPGMETTEGEVLFTLDDRELLLQLQAAEAEVARHAGDAVRAESEGLIAEMRLARAKLSQAEAQRDLVRFRLEQANVAAPFAGIVVEGDLRERIDSPVKQGETLLKIARIEGLYPELLLDERDLRHVTEGATGQVIFATRPNEPFPIIVETIVPVARPDESGNRFTVRCRFADAAPDWWRPGMSGIAKTDAGRRTLFWIATHRTIDRLRMLLW